ncbi:MAG: HAD family hydrolase [Deltaproteobacteria bacterium]|nr:HAD family hydrolase [Deltaproteobacteria bacterium]
MRHTVFLFDIDGTLILTGGAGRKAMESAFRDVYGNKGPPSLKFHFGGMTDRAIVRTAVRTIEGEPDPDAATIDAVLDAYVARLALEVERSDSYRVLPGVTEVLARLRALDTSRVAIGLGTGNVRRGAYTKLARGALGDAFAFGGFGCDHEERAELLRVGAMRGAAALGVPLGECRVVVIGDTPKDVAAALAIGADCVAVGTGGFEVAELVGLGATHGFPDLAHDDVHDALLGG